MTTALERALKTTQLIVELGEKRVQQEKLLAEMEYVLYLKYLWEFHDSEPFEEKSGYYPKFDFHGGSRTKGWLVLVRVTDKVEIRIPVFIRYMSFAGITDMWDNGVIPERFVELFFERSQKYHDVGRVQGYRSQRDKRLEDNAKFKETYGHDRTPRSLMEPFKVTASGDEVRLDTLPGHGGAEKVEPPKSEEGSEGKEGKEVA